MLTINDLNLSIDFWQWLCGLTEDYFYSEEGIREKEFNRLVCLNIKEIYCESKRAAESIIYQAIDGINKIVETDRKISEAFRNNKLYAIIVFNLHNDHTEYYAFIGRYDKITTARLAALKWVWEEISKKEINNDNNK